MGWVPSANDPNLRPFFSPGSHFSLPPFTQASTSNHEEDSSDTGQAGHHFMGTSDGPTLYFQPSFGNNIAALVMIIVVKMLMNKCEFEDVCQGKGFGQAKGRGCANERKGADCEETTKLGIFQ